MVINISQNFLKIKKEIEENNFNGEYEKSINILNNLILLNEFTNLDDKYECYFLLQSSYYNTFIPDNLIKGIETIHEVLDDNHDIHYYYKIKFNIARGSIYMAMGMIRQSMVYFNNARKIYDEMQVDNKYLLSDERKYELYLRIHVSISSGYLRLKSKKLSNSSYLFDVDSYIKKNIDVTKYSPLIKELVDYFHILRISSLLINGTVNYINAREYESLFVNNYNTLIEIFNNMDIYPDKEITISNRNIIALADAMYTIPINLDMINPIRYWFIYDGIKCCDTTKILPMCKELYRYWSKIFEHYNNTVAHFEDDNYSPWHSYTLNVYEMTMEIIYYIYDDKLSTKKRTKKCTDIWNDIICLIDNIKYDDWPRGNKFFVEYILNFKDDIDKDIYNFFIKDPFKADKFVKMFTGGTGCGENSILDNEFNLTIQLVESCFEKSIVTGRYINELESSNQVLENFAYILSHDLKTPLRSIKIRADIINDEFINVEKELKDHINSICENVNKISELVDSSLAYAQIGKNMNFLEYNVIESIVDAVKMVKRGNTNNIKIEILDDEFPMIRADKSLITNIYMNLLNNSIKFNDEKEIIIKIGYRDELAYVEDNGIGMTPKQTTLAFKMF